MEKTLSDLISEINHKLGAAPNSLTLDNKYIRFDIGKKKNKAGWIIGKEWNYNGKSYFAATFGAWNQGNEKHQFVSWSKEEELENKGLKKELKLLEERLKKEEQKLEVERREKIMATFQKFKPLRSADNKYLKSKHVSIHSGLFEDDKNNLIVPVYEDFERTVCGYQRVYGKQKSFPVGQKLIGNFFVFGNPNEFSYIYVCEGIATAATIYEMTGTPVISCFNAGNIPNVISKIKNQLSGKNVVICCDIDKDGAGYNFAVKAKRKFGNAIILKPDFGTKNTALSDFNDLFVAEGSDEVRRQLSVNEHGFLTVDFLGRDATSYYFYSSRDKTVRSYGFDKIRAGHLVELAKEAFWAQKFVPMFDKDGDPTSNCNWKATAEMIVEKQQLIGFYDPSQIRGIGSWMDNQNHVINLGDKLLLNDSESTFGRQKSLKKFYTPSVSARAIKYIDNPINNFKPILDALGLVDFKSKRDVVLFAGFLGYAQIFSTQAWRPHLWLRADKGSGKSSLLSFMSDLIQNSTMLQDSTAAGLRQDMKSDSCVCLMDEQEGEQYRTKQILELARQSSSGSNTRVLRGTTTGEALVYKPELCFAFASIRLPDLTPADESRIIQIFLEKSESSDRSKNEKRVSAFHFAKDLSVDLFSYMNKNLGLFNDSKKEIHNSIMDLGFDARFADQYSPILAAFIIMFPDQDVNEIMLLALQENYDELTSNVDVVSDQEVFRDVLMQTVIKIGHDEKSINQVFDDFLEKESEQPYLTKELEKYGIHYRRTKKLFCFSANNHLKNIIARNSNYKNYWNGFSKNKYFELDNVTIKYKPKRCFNLI